MGDEGSRNGRRASEGVLGPVGTSFAEFTEFFKNLRCVRAVMILCVGRRRLYVHKTQGQCRDVRAQRRNVPEGSVANVTTLRPMSRRSKDP